MSPPQTFTIVGASLAGAKAAEALRAEGFEGRIVLIGAERERPHERPPLSKDYLRGESPRDKAHVHAEGFYADNEIELRTSTSVSAIDTASRDVVLEGGERLRFDRLLLATGAQPRRLPVPGAEPDGVLYLRDLDDADAILGRALRRAADRPGRRQHDPGQDAALPRRPAQRRSRVGHRPDPGAGARRGRRGGARPRRDHRGAGARGRPLVLRFLR